MLGDVSVTLSKTLDVHPRSDSMELAEALTIAHIICTLSNDVNIHKVSVYDQEIPQSHHADQPTAP